MRKALILFIIFFTPILPGNSTLGFEQIKVLFFIASTSLLGLLSVGKVVKLSKLNLSAGLFILILLITSFLGLDPKSSLFGKEPYFQGWILYLYLFLFFLLVKQTKIKLSLYSRVLSLSAILVSLLSIKDWILMNVFHQAVATYAGRVVSTFGQPNFYAGYILLALPFVSHLGRWKYFVLTIGAFGILASGSRASILLLPAVFFFLFLEKVRNKLIFWSAASLCLVGLVTILYISFKSSSGIVWEEVFRPYQPLLKKEADKINSVEKRFYIWPLAWEVAVQQPFFGYGLENISLSLSGYFQKNKHILFEENLNPSPVLISLKDLKIDRTHSYGMDLLMFSGILGFLAWGVYIYLLLRRVRSGTLLFSLCLYLVWSQFQNQSVVHLIYFWLLAGLVDIDKRT